MQFHSKLTSQMEHVMLYEDPNLQTKARRCIPMDELDRKAQSKLDDIKVFCRNGFTLIVTLTSLLYGLYRHLARWSHICGSGCKKILVAVKRCYTIVSIVWKIAASKLSLVEVIRIVILNSFQKQNKSSADVDKQDLLLLELLAWFKKDFFKWVDAPKCDSCGGNTRSVGMATPTPAEENYGAGRVENYFCDKCNQHTRFPRYNYPGALNYMKDVKALFARTDTLIVPATHCVNGFSTHSARWWVVTIDQMLNVDRDGYADGNGVGTYKQTLCKKYIVQYEK